MTDRDFEQFKKKTEDIIRNLQGQIDHQVNEINQLRIRLLDSPRNNIQKMPEEFRDLRVYRLYAGVPIYTTTTGVKGFPGQMFLIKANNATPRKAVAFQIGNTVSSVALT